MGRTNATDQKIKTSELIQFTDRQQEATDALFTHRYILYGGARGGGKSWWLRWALVYMLLFWYFAHGLKRVRVGLFCGSYPELRDRQISKINAEFPAWLGEVKETKEDGLCFFMREDYGGGQIALRNLDDPSKYKSGEFAIIAIDELTSLPNKSTFDILRGSLRWPGIPEGHTIFMAATNPDGVGNLWVRELWIDRIFPPEMEEAADEFIFVQSLPADNPYLDKQYWADLRTQPADVQRAWIEGDWYVFTGQVFPFSRARHVITPCEIPGHWMRITGTDWGYAAPFCTLWAAKDPDTGRVMVYREAYEKGLLDSRQAELIKQMESPGETIRKRYADPSMWTKSTRTDNPTSSYDTYLAHGIYLTPAVNDRLNGKRKVGALIEKELGDGRPGLLVFATCTNLVRTLPSLTYDKTQVEDVNSAGEDHAYDALRYLLTDDREHQAAQKPKQQNPWMKLKSI
jgi:phage terminase large subunit